MTHEQTLGELLAELDADADRRREAEEWAATRRFRADLNDLQELMGQEMLTRSLLRKQAIENFADELLAGRSISGLVDHTSDAPPRVDHTSNTPPRKRMTRDEADCIAQSKWERLKWIDNRSEWAKVIGCDRRLSTKLPTWHAGVEWRRDRRAGVRKKLQRSMSQELLEALSGDKSIIASLSDEDRETWERLTDEQQAQLYNILSEDDE
jgi:hypothetical protein